jgi:hypothetical protein
MSLEVGLDGRALIYCHAGCSFEDICNSLGLSGHFMFIAHPWSAKKVFQYNPIKPSFPSMTYRSGGGRKGRMDFQIYYHPYTTNVRLERVKFDNGEKDCRWQFKEGEHWQYSHHGCINLEELPLYRDSELIQAKYLDEVVVLCESESSVDSLYLKGIHATTWAGGAGQVKIQCLKESLAGMRVLWIADNDKAGLECSEVIESHIKPLASQWMSVIGEEGEDARDLLMRHAISWESINQLFKVAA